MGWTPTGNGSALWITDLATGEDTWIGSLKFPLSKGQAVIRPPSTSTISIYGDEPIRPIDIPQWHVSVKRPSASVGGYVNYRPISVDSFGIQNSGIWYDASEDIVHLRVGGTTERGNAAVDWD